MINSSPDFQLPSPLNNERFAELPTARLLTLTQELFEIGPAFGACLNVALLRGEDDFAERCAANITSAPLIQCFYLYRSGRQWPQLTELIKNHVLENLHQEGRLSSLALDAIVATQSFNSELHRLLITRVAEIKPDLRVSPTIDAFFSRKSQDLGIETNFSSKKLRSTDELHIIGITKVKNEGALVSECVGNLLKFCDEVLIFDNHSSDSCAEEAQKNFGGERITIFHEPDIHIFDEQIIYDRLFFEARARYATHMVLIDADEKASPDLGDYKGLRERARCLHAGDALAVPFRQVSGKGFMDYNSFSALNEQRHLLAPYKDFLYADDGFAVHRKGALHNPWIPQGFPRNRYFIHDDQTCLLHFEKANPIKPLIKNDWYILNELLTYHASFAHILGQYLPMQITCNFMLQHPPKENSLATVTCEDYLKLPQSRLHDIKSLISKLPKEGQFLMNFTY